MSLVNMKHAFKARMIPPTTSGYVLVAAEVEWRGAFRSLSQSKRELLAEASKILERLGRRDDVIEAALFRAVLIPPGADSGLIEEGGIHLARYDVVVLIEATNVETASHVREDADFHELSSMLHASARHVVKVIARNAVRLGDVDHQQDHVYLFNYFHAEDDTEFLPVFERTAGWFQAKTNLPNSTLLQPVEGEVSDYEFINHASWPNFRTFLPSLIFRPGFRRYVLASFEVNNIAAQPILYRIVRGN